MSDYGLLVKNNSKSIQIDSTYRNFSLDESGDSVTITNGNYTYSDYFTSISITSSPLVPLILIRPSTSYYAGVRTYKKTGVNFDRFDVVINALLTSGTSTTSIDWRSYRENRTSSSENYGLLVYNSDGNLCFDSGKNYFKIHSVHAISLTPPIYTDTVGNYTDITHAGISDPFYILTHGSFYNTVHNYIIGQPSPVAYAYWTIGVKQLTSTSVRVGWFPYRYFILGGGLDFVGGINPTIKLLVCNVT